MRVLITGGAGFVGHHFVEHFLKLTDANLVVLDKLTYASSGFDRIRDIQAFDERRVLILAADFAQPLSDGVKREIGGVEYILHLGAESHVDNSIANPEPFVESNVLGTMRMLNFARELASRGTLRAFFYFGTDEVFGPAPEGVAYKESDRHLPKNPYAAAKSGGEMLVHAYRNTYGLPAIITRTMNIFGERQHPEKFIPKVINSLRERKAMPIHADATRTRAGVRAYIHARNVADAYLFLLRKIEDGTPIIGEDFHIIGEREVDNLSLAREIARIMDRELLYEMVDFHSSRPGHDLRYALDGSKIAALGWHLPKTFEYGLEKTVRWFLANDRWLNLS